MAREIVVTSVPRGVRPGRTGFQIVMRTAGLRDDVCDQLESLAVYRHLPPGLGPNPTRYFHNFVQTGLGPLTVLGRVVDAGADYSSRSNKLAHLVILDPPEVAGLRSTSPAAVLALIEGRLATTWQTGPEERQRPLVLDGLAAVRPRICTGWQRAMGDAGWGGVLAERAVSSRPVLVIAADSSPSSCRQLLELFEEAIAIVPPERRWGVTFDTTILTAAPLSWRGTYAGSPESSSRQPGLLVVDLSRPQPVPDDLAASPLVQQARSGQAAQQMQRSGSPPSTPPQIGSRVAPESAAPFGRSPDPDLLTPGPGSLLVPPESRGTAPARSRGVMAETGDRRHPEGSHRYEEPNHWQATVAVVLMLLLVAIAALGTAFITMDGMGQIRQVLAKRVIDAWASQTDGQPPAGFDRPTIDQWIAAFPSSEGANDGLVQEQIQQILEPLNKSLLRESVTPESLQQLPDVKRLITAVKAIETLKSLIGNKQGRGTEEDLRAALAFRPSSEDTGLIEQHADFFASFLASGKAKDKDIESDDAVRQILEAIQIIQGRTDDVPMNADNRKRVSAALNIDYGESSEPVDRLLDELHPEPFVDYEEFRALVGECRVLFTSLDDDPDTRAPIGSALWEHIVAIAENRDIGADWAAQQSRLPINLKAEDLMSIDNLLQAINREPSKPHVASEAAQATLGNDRGFARLTEAISAARKSKRNWWPRSASGEGPAVIDMFGPLPGPLDVEVVVGNNRNFQFEARRDGGTPNWVVEVQSGENTHRVATIEITEKAMRFSPAPISAELSDAALSALRFVPIGFRQTGKSLDGDHWLVLSQPDEVEVGCSEPLTLHAFFCEGKGDGEKLTFGTALPGQRIEWQDHEIPIDGHAIALLVHPEVDNESAIQLQFAAKVGLAPRVLTESIQVEQRGNELVLKGSSKPWSERKTRFKQIDKSRNDHAVIAYQDNTLKPTSYFSEVLLALLERHIENPNKNSHASPLREKWGIGKLREISLPDLKENLIDGLLGGLFGDALFLGEKQSEFTKQQQEPQNPPPFSARETTKDESEEDYLTQTKLARQQHEALERKHVDWVSARSEFIKRALENPSELKRFLRATPKKEGLDPEIAAIHVLSEIDGLIVAKVYQAELEQFLRRVPLTALLKGTVKMDWKLPDLGKVTVDVGHIVPSAVPSQDNGSE